MLLSKVHHNVMCHSSVSCGGSDMGHLQYVLVSSAAFEGTAAAQDKSPSAVPAGISAFQYRHALRIVHCEKAIGS